MASLWGKVQSEEATVQSPTPGMRAITPMRARDHNEQVSISRWGLVEGEAGVGLVKQEWVREVWLDSPLAQLLVRMMSFFHSGVVDPRGDA